MRIKYAELALLWALLLPQIAGAQTPPYPIIFIHGLNSDDGTWQTTINYFRDNFGWNDPYFDDQGIFHALLNASDLSTHYGMDVKTQFPNERNDLYNGNIYAINFKNWWDPTTENLKPRQNRFALNIDFSQSNESAIAKQGYALGQMIKKVLTATGKSKVILVGHSMGGLAAREYLQRKGTDGKPKWWAFPNEPSGHRVAKLVTIGTPHAGSNMTEFGIPIIIDPKSEAARDLSYNYYASGPPNFGINPDHGVYLFGGGESIIPRYNPSNPAAGGYFNIDVDCDGSENSTVWGINSNVIIRADNTQIPLPVDIDYTWIVSDEGVLNGDGAVRLDRQYLDSKGDTLLIHKLHQNETSDYRAIIRGLDEPDESQKAYDLTPGQAVHGFVDRPSGMGPADHDWFRFNVSQAGNFTLSLSNLTTLQNSTTMVVELFSALDLTKPVIDGRNTGGTTQISLITPVLNPGDYFVHLRGVVTDQSWNRPYALLIQSIAGPTQITLSASPSAIKTNGASATLLAELRDAQGNLNPVATNPVTFTITSGATSATLVGPNPVNAVNGIATITLQSTTTPGLVTIQASSPGLSSGMTTVSVYSNPTLVSGAITTNTTWTLANSPYEVIGDVTVAQGITLTIEPGVTVRFNRERDIYVNGALVANGTVSNKIVFTANSDSPFPGYWGGVKFNNSNISNISVLNHCQFLYGGQAFYSEAAPITIDARANPTITNIALLNNLRNGIHLTEGTYNANILLNIVGIPYFLIYDDIRVGQGYTMTIKSGIILKFGSERDLYIDGALVADGTPSQPIIFTAYADDSRGGDTNGDGQTVPQAGSWGGVRFNNSNIGSSSVLNYCQFYYAGQNFYSEASPISVDGRINPKITNTTVANNKLNGIRLLEFTYTSPVLLDVTEIPYFIVFDDVNIAQGVKMAIRPGVILKFGSERDLYINGALDARGTESQPIIFTSIRDDVHGGDTNGDGSTAPRAGDWGGIRFNDSNIGNLSALSYCEFYYGGQGFYSEPSPVAIDARINPVVSNLTLKNNTRNGIRLLEFTYNTNTLLDVIGVPYTILFDDIFVGANARMTIKPGVLIKLGSERDLVVRGALIADGAADQPIVFSSINDDAHGGDTNNDGPTLPAPGGWGGVLLEESTIDHLSVLKYCQFYYGGQSFYSQPSPLTVDPRTRPAMANLAFANNTNNGIDLLGGGFNTHLFLETTGVPYTVRRDDIIVSQGTRMTISPGVIVKFGSERDLHVRGALIANGTAGNPIIFTSLKDDASGGDANGDGESVGLPGDWGGIRFFDTSDDLTGSLDFCRIAFGGQGFYSEQHPLVFDNASPKIQNTIIPDSRSHGVICYGTASPDFGGGSRGSVGQNRFLGYAEVTDKYAFYNDGTATIYAKSNYWGTTDRNTIQRTIYDFSDNPQKGRVIFEPFTTVEDTEAPHVSVLFPNGGETLLAGRVATLRWYVRDNVGVTQVSVSLSRDGGQVFQPLTSFTGQQEEYAWTAAGPFSSRCLLKVTARDAAGNERFDVSDNFFAIVDSGSGVNYPPSTPLPLRPLAGEEMRGNDLLIWQASVDPNPFDRIVYRLEIDNNADFLSPELVEDNIDSSRTTAISESAKSSFTLAGQNVLAVRLDRLAGFAMLQDDVTYYWRLRARDQQNAMSAFSSGTARFFMNKINTPPQAVVNGFSPANNLEVRAARPTISWQAADDPDPSDGAEVLRYRLQLDDDGEFINDVAISVQTNPGVTFYVPAQDLHENARYSWRVQASDDEGANSPWSAVQSFFVNAIKEPPRPFEILSPPPIFISSNDTVIFRWQTTTDPDPFDSLRYVVEWSTNRSFSPLNKLLPNSTTQYAFARPSRVDSVFWRLYAVDADTLSTYASNSKLQPRMIRWQKTSVSSRDGSIPAAFSLAQNYPNPFNPETTIEFALPNRSLVTIRIFNLVGSEIRTLLEKEIPPGYHKITWDGKDATGRPVPSGVYLYKMQAADFVAVRKSVVIR